MNSLAETEDYSAIDPETMPVNLVFQSYHLMVAMFGLMALTLLLALIFTFKGGSIKKMRWLQWLIIISPIFAVLAIQSGWATAEFGRQPWVVYPSVTGPEGVELLTADGISLAVSGWELIATIVLFVLIYLVLFIAWARIVARFIKQGPTQEQPAPVAASSNSFMSGTPPAKAADASANDETAPAATKEGE